MITNKDLKRRIIEISWKKGLSHLGSCLSAVDVMNDIYSKMTPADAFFLSAGHSGLALYVVLEKYFGYDAEMLFDKHGVHPNRDLEHGILVSSGSLGHGLPIACGYALGNPDSKVYVLITDGEAHEGSVYESLNVIADRKIGNIEVHCNWNGVTAYKHPSPNIDKFLKDAGVIIHDTTVEQLPFLKGIDAHYAVMDEKQYLEAMEILK